MCALVDWKRASELMERQDMDALLASSKRNYLYLTGRPLGAITFYKYIENGVPCTALAVLCRDSPEPIGIIPTGGIDKKTGVGAYFEVIEGLVRELSERGLNRGRIAVELSDIPVEMYEKLKELMPQATFLNADKLLWDLRMVKTEEEVRHLRKAMKIAEFAQQTAYATAKEGVQIKAIWDAYKRAIEEEGGIIDPIGLRGHMGFWRLEESGKQVFSNALTHPKKRLRRGMWMRFDCYFMYEFYWSDISRVGCVGRPKRYMEELYDVAMETHERLFKLVKPGVRGSEVWNRATEGTGAKPYYEITAKEQARGVPCYHNRAIGHGVGLAIHEAPYLSPGVDLLKDAILKPGMTIALEAAVSNKKVGVCNIEDVVLVTDSGCDPLSALSREINVV